MPQERPEIHAPTEACEESWRQYIAEFKRGAFLMFSEEGITLAEAMMIWELSRIRDELEALRNEDSQW